MNKDWNKITKVTPAKNKIVNIELTDNTTYSFDLPQLAK